MEDILDRINDLKSQDSGEQIDKNQINDQREAEVQEWFRDVEFRLTNFKDYYPFSFEQENELISLNSNLGLKQKLYIFLLIASNLRCLDRKSRHKFTSGFEVLSLQVLRHCLPAGAEVHLFGSSNSSIPSKYNGNLWHKLTQLASDLGGVLNVDEEEFSSRNTGDKGLDLVGWIPSFDDLPGKLVIFAQCACTHEWTTKQHSSGKAAWSSTINFRVGPANAVIIPICFRRMSGKFYRESDIHDSILIDRLRFVGLLDNQYEGIQELPVFSEIEKIIAEKEDIF